MYTKCLKIVVLTENKQVTEGCIQTRCKFLKQITPMLIFPNPGLIFPFSPPGDLPGAHILIQFQRRFNISYSSLFATLLWGEEVVEKGPFSGSSLVPPAPHRFVLNHPVVTSLPRCPEHSPPCWGCHTTYDHTGTPKIPTSETMVQSRAGWSWDSWNACPYALRGAGQWAGAPPPISASALLPRSCAIRSQGSVVA